MYHILESIGIGILNAKYTLIEIEEEKIPLAMSTQDVAGYFGTVIVVMACLLILCAIVIYVVSCYKYRVRIRQLQSEKVHCGWNLMRLREAVTNMELQEAERLVNDMEQNFRKKIKEAEPFLE